MFAQHRVPHTLVSDNGPQYDSAEFAAFVKDFGLKHVTSSLCYPRADGCAECAVIEVHAEKSQRPLQSPMPQNLLFRLPNILTLREKKAEYKNRMKSDFATSTTGLLTNLLCPWANPSG